jgi:hypothetical protein
MNLKTYACGCQAGPAEEVPNYCPEHGVAMPTMCGSDATRKARDEQLVAALGEAIQELEASGLCIDHPTIVKLNRALKG